jgi:DNA-binding response OmpR family regulator
VVDDEADVLNLTRIILERANYEVQTVLSVEEAFSKIEESTPDLILLDVVLPDMDGCELCKRLKENPETSSIPVVMYSASGGDRTLTRVREAGADDFLLKPFTVEQLLTTIQKHLRSGV